MRLDHLLSRMTTRFIGRPHKTPAIQNKDADRAAREGASAVLIVGDRCVGNGAIAQLGEHLLCKQGVVGSIPTGSTKPERTARMDGTPGRCCGALSMKAGL